jgi:hypothetical protein
MTVSREVRTYLLPLDTAQDEDFEQSNERIDAILVANNERLQPVFIDQI